MESYQKNRIVELKKEVEELEIQMLNAFDFGNKRTYNNLKNEQYSRMKEIKKLESHLGNDNS